MALLPLLVFKYYSFLNDSISAGLASIGLQFALPGLNWAIPVGISFFTFQAVGYMLDVYHGRVKTEKNLLDYLLFVSFSLQVMSGPISKADELLPQIKNPHKFNYEQGKQGLKWLLWGMELICFVSPIYKGTANTDYYEPVVHICVENKVPSYYYGYSSDISPKKQLFQDRVHLNDEGAQLYASKIAQIIKDKIFCVN